MRAWGMTMAAVLCLLAGTAQARMPQVVTIGVLTDLGGQHTENSGLGSITAAQFAVEDFGGTVNGAPVRLIYADHQNSPEVGAAIAANWYDQGVDMIVDVPNSLVALAVQKVARAKHRIVMFSGGGSSELTNDACSPTGVQFTYDTYALANVIGKALLARGGRNWYFITADYTFGKVLEKDTAAVVTANGGHIAGAVRFPPNNADLSPYLVQAYQSGADVLAIASAGADAGNAVRQATEMGLTQPPRQMAALLFTINYVEQVGLSRAHDLLLSEAFYWDMNDQTRAFSERFIARRHTMPNMVHAGVAGAVLHYLKAVQAADSVEADPVMAEMRARPVSDFMTANGRLRADGRVIRDMYLFQVKTPAESKGPWDDYKLISVIPGDEAFRPLSESRCPLVLTK